MNGVFQFLKVGREQRDQKVGQLLLDVSAGSWESLILSKSLREESTLPSTICGPTTSEYTPAIRLEPQRAGKEEYNPNNEPINQREEDELAQKYPEI